MSPLFSDVQGALRFLKWASPDLKEVDQGDFVLTGRDSVLNRFGPLFRDRHTSLTESDLASFLDFNENHHWTGLHRQKTNLVGNMDLVRKAIGHLSKSTRGDVASRFDYADKTVKGFGEGIITPILFVMFPNDFAVWNSKSEHALRRLGLWIHDVPRESKGAKYEKVNNAIYYAAKNLGIDLWTIDHHWHAIKVLDDAGELEPLARKFILEVKP